MSLARTTVLGKWSGCGAWRRQCLYVMRCAEVPLVPSNRHGLTSIAVGVLCADVTMRRPEVGRPRPPVEVSIAASDTAVRRKPLPAPPLPPLLAPQSCTRSSDDRLGSVPPAGGPALPALPCVPLSWPPGPDARPVGTSVTAVALSPTPAVREVDPAPGCSGSCREEARASISMSSWLVLLFWGFAPVVFVGTELVGEVGEAVRRSWAAGAGDEERDGRSLKEAGLSCRARGTGTTRYLLAS